MTFKKITRRLLASAATVAVGASLLPMSIATAAPVVDGSSSDKAAASCYEIKLNNPSAKSGAYWLYTPQMEAPEQFYCDQETNGGGWLMIGRGRENWTEDYSGKGTAKDLAQNPDGTDAFTPAQLDSTLINALMGGKSPSSLEDGIRFNRAANINGTQFQNSYAKRLNTESWSWTLRAKANWGDVKFDSISGLSTGSSLASSLGNIAKIDNRFNVLDFYGYKANSYKQGFGYGYGVNGNTSSSSYLWSQQTGYAVPFTQVFIRPKLTQSDAGFSAFADSGVAQEQQRQVPTSFSAPMKWRTSLESGTGVVGEMNTSVQAITQVGNTVFTGGDFKNVVSASGETVDQAFLAGYDVNTSELVRSFRPTFNGQIKAVEGLSNGKLAVGGEFTKVNGEDVSGFVVLDPVTGAIDKTYKWSTENRLATETTRVKTIQEINGYLYIGGAFTHVTGNTSTSPVYARNAARFKMSDGSVDKTWKPEFNGTVNGINAGADNQHVYAAGYFTTNHGEKAFKLADMNAANGYNSQVWDWKPSYVSPTDPVGMGFHFDVQDADNSVFTGGAEHIIAQYDKATLARMSSSITRAGGDFQDLFRDKKNGIIYGSCHCYDWVYEGGDIYQNPWTTSKDIHKARTVIAFDDKTGEVIPEFSPVVSGQRSQGVWESFVDSTGVLWIGGDIDSTLSTKGNQNTVGFARFTPKDVTPAAAPKNLTVTSTGTKDTLSWTSGTRTATSYQVLRNDRVIATVPAGTTSYEVGHQDGARYFVRSVDQAGNYSATTSVAIAPNVAQPTSSATPSATATPTTSATATPVAVTR